MIPDLRTAYNHSFNESAYQKMLTKLNEAAGKELEFRVAETPVFVSHSLKEKMIEVCESVMDFILNPDFKSKTANAIPARFQMQENEDQAQFFVFDFGIVENKEGQLDPALIELQGFPSLFAFQHFLDLLYRESFNIPSRCNSFLSGYMPESYSDFLKIKLLGNEDPNEVVLMDLNPDQQKTAIDFKLTEKMTGIKTVCIQEIKQENKRLYHQLDGKKTRIKRIFNRFVPDEWNPSITFDFKKEMDVQWMNHPHDYFRISKYILPFLSHTYIPETYFLSEFKQQFPLNESVIKPLFSFAGKGVLMDVKEQDILQISNPEEWIIQKKMTYASAIETLDEAAKTEIRIFYIRPKKDERPIPVHNLARISKGSMIGTQFNKDKNWVGGSIAYFDQA